jgi:hypothetical protein
MSKLGFIKIEVIERDLATGEVSTYLDREAHLPDNFPDVYAQRVQYQLEEFLARMPLPLIGGRYQFRVTTDEKDVVAAVGTGENVSWDVIGSDEDRLKGCLRWSTKNERDAEMAADRFSEEAIRRLLLSITNDIWAMQNAIIQFTRFIAERVVR